MTINVRLHDLTSGWIICAYLGLISKGVSRSYVATAPLQRRMEKDECKVRLPLWSSHFV